MPALTTQVAKPVDTAVEVDVEGLQVPLEVLAPTARPGQLTICGISSLSFNKLLDFSYTCGGVGHLSRDCVQGAKCYNCSGTVRHISLLDCQDRRPPPA